MLRCFGIGAGDEHPAVGPVRERVPHLLPVDDPLIAVAHCTGRQAREVGAGTGLAEELAPQLLAGEQRPQEPRLELVVGVGRDRRRGKEDAESVALERVGAHAGGSDAFVDAPLQLGRQREPAEPHREPHPGEAEVVLRGAERDRVGGIVLGEEPVDERIDTVGASVRCRSRRRHPFERTDRRGNHGTVR